MLERSTPPATMADVDERRSTTCSRPRQERTGLADFGDDSFREGLERLVRSLETEATLNALGEVVLPELITQAPHAAPADRGLVPAPPRDRRRADRRAADRPRPAPHRLDGAVVPARRGSRAPGRSGAGRSSQPCPPPSTVDGARSAHRRGRRPGWRCRTRSHPRLAALVPGDADRARWSARTSWPSTSRPTTSRRSPTCRRTPSGCSTPTSPRPTAYERRVLKLLQWGEPTAAVAAEVPVAPAVARPPRPRCSPTPAS